MTDAGRLAAAQRWFKQLGRRPVDDGALTIVVEPALPNVWDANFAYVRAGISLSDLAATLDRHMQHTPWRVVVTDALTDTSAEAMLALAGFVPRLTTIEMLANRVAGGDDLSAMTMRIVTDDGDWSHLKDLVEADHAEGLRTGETTAEVSAGLFADMRVEAPPGEYRLIVVDDVAVGYGLSVVTPQQLGLIEHLFILPAYRRRGLMSAYLADAHARLRKAGCTAVFLDALADAEAKRLYAARGFSPVALTRTWVHNTASA